MMSRARRFRANSVHASHIVCAEMHFHLPVANMAILRSRTTTPFDMTPVRHAAPAASRVAAAAPGSRGARGRPERPCHP
ncbi:conserved hypothetical protein [Burkholderia vietnamiensis]|nr:conserved hypothetical protein [Burkholderia vietnamiensis]